MLQLFLYGSRFVWSILRVQPVISSFDCNIVWLKKHEHAFFFFLAKHRNNSCFMAYATKRRNFCKRNWKRKETDWLIIICQEKCFFFHSNKLLFLFCSNGSAVHWPIFELICHFNETIAKRLTFPIPASSTCKSIHESVYIHRNKSIDINLSV